MKLKKFNQYLSEALPPMTGAPAAATGQSSDPTIQDLQKSAAAYTQNKAQVDGLLRNPTLTANEEALQKEYDKVVASADNKDLINIYFATKKLEMKKVQMDAQMKELATQIKQKADELAAAEQNLK